MTQPFVWSYTLPPLWMLRSRWCGSSFWRIEKNRSQSSHCLLPPWPPGRLSVMKSYSLASDHQTLRYAESRAMQYRR